MKKIIHAVLLVCIVVLLTACGNKEESQECTLPSAPNTTESHSVQGPP